MVKLNGISLVSKVASPSIASVTEGLCSNSSLMAATSGEGGMAEYECGYGVTGYGAVIWCKFANGMGRGGESRWGLLAPGMGKGTNACGVGKAHVGQQLAFSWGSEALCFVRGESSPLGAKIGEVVRRAVCVSLLWCEKAVLWSGSFSLNLRW